MPTLQFEAPCLASFLPVLPLKGFSWVGEKATYKQQQSHTISAPAPANPDVHTVDSGAHSES